MTYIAIVSWHDYGARHRFYLVEQDLNLIRRYLVISMMFVSLLHLWACLTRPVVIVAGGGSSLAGVIAWCGC